MSRTQMYDPGSTEARSALIAGLTEICSKLSGVLNMQTDTFVNLPLTEVFITPEDRYRIYQAPLGNKLWMQSPAPVIRKNGNVITPENDGFEIDYIGGSIAFEDSHRLVDGDVVSASATYIIDKSSVIDTLQTQLNALSGISGSFKGSFYTYDDLKSIEGTGELGDFAIVQENSTIYVWSEGLTDWVDVYKETDLSNYLTKEQIEGLLELKEDDIATKGDTADADMFYYGGRKTWVSLAENVLSVTLAGLVSDTNLPIDANDTLLEAFGKLQAQINANIHPISGNTAPSVDTVGKVGQDYIDTSNGNKFHLMRIEDEATTPTYIWEQYADVTAVKYYVDTSIQSAVYNAFNKSY